MPDRVITLLYKLFKGSSREYTQYRLALINLHKNNFYWENDNLDNSEFPVEYPHPEIPAQMPSIDL